MSYDLAFDMVTKAFKENPPTQDPEECARLCEHVLALKPSVVLEIGMYTGGTMNTWSKFATDDALLIGVDIEDRVTGRKMTIGTQKLDLVFKDSTAMTTIEEVKRLLNGRMVDFLFIDGLHTYEACLADLMNYEPLVRPGGIVALHDAVGNHQVMRAIKEFTEKSGYYSEVFYNPLQKARMGIQCFWKPK